jgi:hypothetical protein
VDEAIAAFQPIESNASPCCQTILPNIVVLDLDSIGKRPLASALTCNEIWQSCQSDYPYAIRSLLRWLENDKFLHCKDLIFPQLMRILRAQLQGQTHLMKLNSSTTSGTFENRYISPRKSGSIPLLALETHLYFSLFLVESSNLAFSFPYNKSHFT